MRINRASVREKARSAKATETEAGQSARAVEGNAGPVPFLPSLAELQRWAGLFQKHGLIQFGSPSFCHTATASRSVS